MLRSMVLRISGRYPCSGGATLAFHDSGGEGPPLVLLHGWMTDQRVFEDLLPFLSPSRRYVVPNLRGTEGEVHDYSIDAYVADVLALADQLSLSSFGIVGHSFGGQLAQNVAARAPERVTALVLLNPVPTRGLPLPDEMAAHFRSAGGNAQALGGIIDGVCVALPAATRERLLAIAVAQPAATIAGCFGTWSAGRPHEDLEIRCATHVLTTDDPVLQPELLRLQVVEKIPGARSTHMPKNGHYPLSESPQQTAAWIDAISM
jgi:pimeloyl-ACP methyl ester carboxylesterase